MVEFFLLRKSGDIDGFEPRQRLTRMFKIVRNRFVRIIAHPVVVTVVADLRREFWLRSQRVLPFVGEQTI